MKLRATILVIASVSYLLAGGCAHEHHQKEERTEVIVRDERGWDHRGWYDRHGDWHGYYYDDRHERHEDERDWGRTHDRDWKGHREHFKGVVDMP